MQNWRFFSLKETFPQEYSGRAGYRFLEKEFYYSANM
jgi:hypothetical protein